VSVIALIDQDSALADPAGSPSCSRFHAIRHRAEQNRACSRRGAKNLPHCWHFRASVTAQSYARRTRLMRRMSASLRVVLPRYFHLIPGSRDSLTSTAKLQAPSAGEFILASVVLITMGYDDGWPPALLGKH
jgi:hypothetical protein